MESKNIVKYQKIEFTGNYPANFPTLVSFARILLILASHSLLCNEVGLTHHILHL